MSLPAITTDINQARTDIRNHGLALIEGQLTPARLELARAATYEGQPRMIASGAGLTASVSTMVKVMSGSGTS
ncbi:MAG: hypothetical protein ACPGPD_08385 [Pseudomonadales bacterium]